MEHFIKCAGYAAQSPRRSYASNWSSANVNGQSNGKLLIHPGSIDVGSSNTYTSRTDNSKYVTENGNLYQPQTVKSRIANISGTEYEKISSQQALKRTVPSSLVPSSTSSKLNSSLDNISRGHNLETYGSSQNPSGLSLINGKSYMQDPSSRGTDDEVIMYGNGTSRILPPSLMHGKSIPTMQFAISSDPAYRSGISEENAAGSDERLIYQAALEVFFSPFRYIII